MTEKTLKCSENGCNNKFFKMDKITPFIENPVCRKHYYMFSYGYSEQEASKK